MDRRRLREGTLALLLLAGLAAGCTSTEQEPGASPAPAPSASPSPGARASEPPLAAAESTPVEDPVYPRAGDPGVDALRYHLRLAWEPRTRTLDGVETLLLRATADAGELRLDLAPALRVRSLTLDDRPARFEHTGKELVIQRPVRADQRHVLRLRYRGSPRPVPAPTTRTDLPTLGWTVTPTGDVWTMQEPYGAYTWYAVNDQPSDKALYSFRITAPAPWVGVANGELLSSRRSDGSTVSRWRLDQPASSYLVTIAIGDYRRTVEQTDSGVPVSYWTPPDRPDLLQRLRAAPAALAWVEDRLGPYPFDSLGFVLVDSRSGMETQTMITLGANAYATAPEVLVHEIAHQWYGDLVTPADWRDVWMNEGMATYLQGVWTAEQRGEPVETVMQDWARREPAMRAEAGPPADYDPRSFGSGNVYYGPALMWDALRRRLGDEEFWRLVRAWPAAHARGNADYGDLTAWWSEQTGEDLSGFFDAWLRGSTSPERN